MRDRPWPVSSSLALAMNRRFDAIVIGAGQAGPPMAGRIAAAGKDGRPHRAQAHRRNLRQHRLHADQDVGRQRLCRPSRAARRRLRRDRRTRRRRFRGRHGPQGQVVGDSRSDLEAWLRGHGQLHRLSRVRRASCRRRQVRVGDDVLEAERFFINVGCRAVVPDFPGVDQVRTLTNTTLLELDALPARISSSSAEAISASSSRRCSAASAREVTVVEKAPRLIPARGRGRVGRDPRDPRSGGHHDPAATRNASASRRAARTSRSASIARRANPKWSAPTCCSRSAAGRTPTTSGSRRRASRSTRAATSSSTTN